MLNHVHFAAAAMLLLLLHVSVACTIMGSGAPADQQADG
jgi:hypothetical protein